MQPDTSHELLGIAGVMFREVWPLSLHHAIPEFLLTYQDNNLYNPVSC